MKKIATRVLLFLLVLCCVVIPTKQVQAGTLYESPYVEFSPDNYAWTVAEELPYTGYVFDYHYPDNIPEYWYPKREVIDTGIASTLRALATGEHYYAYDRQGEIPVGYWEVRHTSSSCIHDKVDYDWHGVSNSAMKCFNAYYSGWFAYCADCGEVIRDKYVYMSRAAAATITSIDVDKGYYYHCPTCGDLEQAVDSKEHSCRKISWNMYNVEYDNNISVVGTSISGDMPESYHMYNNATEYEGNPVTPITHLSKNQYSCIGYEFVGWNTEPDGSGRGFADEAEIFNLTAYDCEEDGALGTVTLYAQWKKSDSTLRIDPNGGRYNGSTSVTAITQGYMTQYVVDNSKVTAPKGCTVSFDTNGGAAVAPITGTTHFVRWNKVPAFYGLFINNIYTFFAANGNIDTIQAEYEADAITLPGATKPNSSFGGWYYDEEFTKPAGGAGDRITPTQDTTLHAQWVDLKLYSKDNYTANNKKGAVDLNWTQSDGNNKTYKLYQSTDAKNWKQINSAQDIGSTLNVTQNFSYTGTEQTYTIPYSGMYTLTASAAQGENYDSYKGGL